MGALRMKELYNIKITDVERHGKDLLLIKIPTSKTKVKKSFTIQGDYLELVERYIALRPKTFKEDNFFVRYQNRRCMMQVIGINTLRAVPKVVAKYLNLPDPEQYTGEFLYIGIICVAPTLEVISIIIKSCLGHCFRRTSTSILANAGASAAVIKRHGAWKSEAIANKYIEDSLEYKKKTGDLILSAVSGNKSKNIEIESNSSNFNKADNAEMKNLNFNTVEVESSQGFYECINHDATSSLNFIPEESPNPDICVNNSQLSEFILEDYEMVSSVDDSIVKTKPKKFIFKKPVFYKFTNCTVNINN